MDLKATQRLLAALYTDVDLRRRFSAEPEAIAREYGIAPDAARQLANLSAAQVEGFSRTLERKRLSELRRALPATCHALGTRFVPLIRKHIAEFHPQGIQRQLDDAVAFARMLGHDSGPTADLARHEAIWLQFRHGRRWPLFAIFSSDPRVIESNGFPEQGRHAGLIACWFRFGGRVRHVAIRSPKFVRPVSEAPTGNKSAFPRPSPKHSPLPPVASPERLELEGDFGGQSKLLH